MYCFKKALLTIHAVAQRFGGASARPDVPVPGGTDRLPVFADNVIPSLLVHLGVLDLSAAQPSLGLAELFPGAGSAETLEALLAEAPAPAPAAAPGGVQEGPVLTAAQAYVLRAAAIAACERVVEVARGLDVGGREELGWMGAVTAAEVDAWVWAVAKDRADYRRLQRFVLRDTPYF